MKTSHKDSAPILLGLVVQGDAALDHVSASSVFQVFWDTYVNVSECGIVVVVPHVLTVV